MKLSEAIRLGAMLKPQGMGFNSTDWYTQESTCAFGAALHAVGVKPDMSLWGGFPQIGSLWPMVYQSVPCPASGGTLQIMNIVWGLNDRYGWDRNRIADWVESIENTLDASKEAPCASSASMPISEVSTGA